MNNNNPPNTSSQHAEQNPPKVLAGIDGSEISAAVADYAAWIAGRVNVPLKLLYNLENRGSPAVSDLSGSIGLGSREHLLEELTELEAKRSRILMEQGKLLLAEANKRAEQAGVADAILCQRGGSLMENLVDMEADTRVLVLGISGSDSQKNAKHMGTHLETILRTLHKPILVVNREFKAPERIMLAYDSSVEAQKALDMVVTSPLYRGLTCHLVHASHNEAEAEKLLQHARGQLEGAGFEVISEVLSGNPEQAVLDYQTRHDIDMMVMGSFGHSRLRDMLLGSFTLKMLSGSSIPLLLLR